MGRASWSWADRNRPSLVLSSSLALSSLNKHVEAVAYYKKALELDPDNETYKSNLKIAELKLREAPSPVSAAGRAAPERGAELTAGRGRGLGHTSGSRPNLGVVTVRGLFRSMVRCTGVEVTVMRRRFMPQTPGTSRRLQACAGRQREGHRQDAPCGFCGGAG